MELYCDIYDGTGPYLLFVHGFLSSRAQWALNLTALARVVRPVVVGAEAGHAVNIEAAEAFNTAVIDLLGRHTS